MNERERKAFQHIQHAFSRSLFYSASVSIQLRSAGKFDNFVEVIKMKFKTFHRNHYRNNFNREAFQVTSSTQKYQFLCNNFMSKYNTCVSTM